MEVINGEFYMAGCREDDPMCIHSPDELKRLISEIGFMPLFSNTIPGFSVEERTPVSAWWTGDLESDPWEWRQLLSADPDLAYGKFYDRKAGYVSKEWFPVFANYRRNGYDFDVLLDDELVPYRNQMVMEAFSLNEDLTGLELMSYELKERAHAGKNIEGCITELQMQTYLLTGAFRQKRNKLGLPYGWHVAAFMTPETKWGHEYLRSNYHEDPAKSWEKITGQIRKYFPDAGDPELKKLLGIRYPGESHQIEHKEGKTKPIKQGMPPYPENLLRAIGLQELFESDTYETLTDDQTAGLEYVLSCFEKAERDILLSKYRDGIPCTLIAKNQGRTPDQIRRTLHALLCRIRCERELRGNIRYGALEFAKMEADRKAGLRKALSEVKDEQGKIALFKDIPIEELKLPTKEYHCVLKCGVRTVGDLMEKRLKPGWYAFVRYLDVKGDMIIEDRITAYISKIKM